MGKTMKDIRTTSSSTKGALGKQRSYNEIIEFLDSHWTTSVSQNALAMLEKLDSALGSPSKKIRSIAVAGTSGKSLTVHFATQLLKQEGLKVGSMYAPHIMTYNERISINDEVVSNKEFAEVANEVISAVESHDLKLASSEILTMMAILHFAQQKVDVVLLEVEDVARVKALSLFKPLIVAITRVVDEASTDKNAVPTDIINKIMEIVSKGTHVVSADQSKASLQLMHELSQGRQAQWGMPIRKLAQLAYPFEQLHGRCAALAERIADLFVNNFVNKDAVVLTNTLLTKEVGVRGRPTLEAKRQAELNPKRTLDQFWHETQNQLAGRFQLLEKEKPTILLDTANNLDAIENVLLGIRLLHYQRPLKGLTLVLGCDNADLNVGELMRALRYFFKKTSGQVVICPTAHMPCGYHKKSWDAEKVANEIKTMKIKVRAAKNFAEAFDFAQKSVDERHGLVVITGSTTLVNEYWNFKGIKKI